MSNYYFGNSQEMVGDILVDRRTTARPVVASHLHDLHRKMMAAAPPNLGFGASSNAASATAVALHSGNWTEMAQKACLNRRHGNGCWARHCACEACRPYARRGSNTSSDGGFDQLEPLVVTDEQLRMTYEVWGLRQNELPIKGTYIDPRIIPGFKYRVRYLGGNGGPVFPEAVRLVSIGAGYGKRLTFDTKPLAGREKPRSAPPGYFWSDSRPEGYALALAPLDVGQRFLLKAARGGGQELLGRATVTWVAPEPGDCRLRVESDSVKARVAVAFRANLSLTACRCLLGCHEYEDVPLTGLAWLERPAGSRGIATVTRVEGVRLPDMPELRLLPVD